MVDVTRSVTCMGNVAASCGGLVVCELRKVTAEVRWVGTVVVGSFKDVVRSSELEGYE